MALSCRFAIAPSLWVFALTIQISGASVDRFSMINFSKCGKACVGKRLNQVSRFGCTEQNKLFKDAPDVACLCSEANLESVIASCMQSSCPKDPEVLGIGAFLDRFCLSDPAITRLQQNLVARQGVDTVSLIAEPTDSLDIFDTVFTSSPTSANFPSVTSSTFSSSAPTSGRAVTSTGIVTPTPTSVEAPILTTKSPSPTIIPTKGSSGGLSKGAAAGLAIGVVIGVIALAAGAFLLWRRQKGRWANNTVVANDTSHDYPESGKAESRAKTTYAIDGDAVAEPKQTTIAAASTVEHPNDRFDVSSLPELVSIENEQGARKQLPMSANRKYETASDELARLEEEERRIGAAIANAEHLERLRIEQRAVQSRIQEARGNQT